MKPHPVPPRAQDADHPLPAEPVCQSLCGYQMDCHGITFSLCSSHIYFTQRVCSVV